MSKPKSRWAADRGARAIRGLADIEASIAALANEDLLDFADSFEAESPLPLEDIAVAEMRKRSIALEPKPPLLA